MQDILKITAGILLAHFVMAIIAIMFLALILTGPPAHAQETETLEVATIVVTEYWFGDHKRDWKYRTYVIDGPQLDPATCHDQANVVEGAVQGSELAEVARVNHTQWGPPKSRASCHIALHIVPISVITVEPVCHVVRDTSQGDILTQMRAACPTL
jgi:hypothetical protein